MRESRKGNILFRLATILVMTACGATLPAQQESPQAEANPTGSAVVRKVIPVKHVDVKEVAELIGPWGLQMNMSRRLGLISLVGDKATVESAEKIIREIDLPRVEVPAPRSENVEIVFHLLGAGVEPAASELAGNARLRSVVEELKGKFPYRSFQLLETGAVRVRSRYQASTKGLIPGIAPGIREPATYSFQVHVYNVLERQDKHLIPLGKLILTLRVPVPTDKAQVQYEEVEIRSEVNVLEGKTVVVGKTSVLGSVRGLFLILTANVVE